MQISLAFLRLLEAKSFARLSRSINHGRQFLRVQVLNRGARNHFRSDFTIHFGVDVDKTSFTWFSTIEGHKLPVKEISVL